MFYCRYQSLELDTEDSDSSIEDFTVSSATEILSNPFLAPAVEINFMIESDPFGIQNINNNNNLIEMNPFSATIMAPSSTESNNILAVNF